MSDKQNQHKENRFYKHSYMLLPIPLLASIIFTIYVIYNTDKDVVTFCVTALAGSSYHKEKLIQDDFSQLESINLEMCKIKDGDIDNGDGREHGRVRWFVCKGTTCGPGWETILRQH